MSGHLLSHSNSFGFEMGKDAAGCRALNRNYYCRRCASIDALIAKKQQYLIEIENYKKSLIYEYVTGKKEVV